GSSARRHIFLETLRRALVEDGGVVVGKERHRVVAGKLVVAGRAFAVTGLPEMVRERFRHLDRSIRRFQVLGDARVQGAQNVRRYLHVDGVASERVTKAETSAGRIDGVDQLQLAEPVDRRRDPGSGVPEYLADLRQVEVAT